MSADFGPCRPILDLDEQAAVIVGDAPRTSAPTAATARNVERVSAESR
jgi:hypothetical protein